MPFAFLIPGFLGLSLDWENCIPSGINYKSIDLFASSLGKAGEAFNDLARKESEPPFLIGYSLGGRIALHALTSVPELWKAGVIISAHPGLLTEKEKSARLDSDQKWAHRFEKDPWEDVLADWNAQGVFKLPQARQEADYSRIDLSQALTQYSLGLQEDLREKIKNLKIPLLWIVGDDDLKFKKLGEEIAALNPRILLKTMSHCGHRVLQEQPEALKTLLSDFLSRQ